jgi:signal transduction histidine kinase
MSMFLAHRWRWRDVAARSGDVLIGLVTLVVVASVIRNAVHNDQPITVLLIPAAVAAILLRNRHSAAALLIAVGVDCAIPANRALGLPAMVVLYTIAVRAPWRVAAGAAAGAAVMALIAGAAWGGSGVTSHGGLLGYAIGSTASLAAAAALGLYVGARRRVLEGLRERAERLDRERELLADRAVAQERIRIAQELHDIVAHNVSLMVVEAQALGATVHKPSRASLTPRCCFRMASGCWFAASWIVCAAPRRAIAVAAI